MKIITIIVPSYNEESALPFFYEEIKKYMNKNYQFYLLFVNDGSKDKTIHLIKDFQQHDSNVKYIDLSRNFGKESAMYAGLIGAKALNSDAAIFIDADLQDPPYLIDEMIKYYENGYLHIYTKHASRKAEPKLKTLFAMLFYKIYTWITQEQNLEKGARDFSLLDRKVIDAFLKINDQKRFTKGIFTWVGYEKKCIEFDYVPRVAGKTKWSFKKLFKYAIDGINQFSHMYKIIAKLGIFASFSYFVYDLTVSLVEKRFDIHSLFINTLIVLLFVVLHAIMNVQYDVRDQVLKRPIYLVKNSNIEGLNDIY
jgi:glycosyltransferase involved in cell wall biosynthesis